MHCLFIQIKACICTSHCAPAQCNSSPSPTSAVHTGNPRNANVSQLTKCQSWAMVGEPALPQTQCHAREVPREHTGSGGSYPWPTVSPLEPVNPSKRGQNLGTACFRSCPLAPLKNTILVTAWKRCVRSLHSGG